ncbi:hypothetical protein FV232_24930 [Methylobacterium sp. WL30]|uniref:hypothetical protein n=1 Tax=unclassified Methylobacterium TaxID=2615210 RepID=UPI0011C939B3|nr:MULTISPECIES: hypothetical protein [unclassified Methylobacterium]TXN38466.1 hypothetical protein FV225_13840 [Methylobacterium sp. WL93]TXN62660.1 hypothetical protein FV232_24930 [Methylobacterium sp. WL30]
MSKRNNARNSLDAAFAAGVIVIGGALAVEMRYFLPHNPVAAFFKVLGAAMVATAITLRLSRR